MNLKDFKKTHEDEEKAILTNKSGHSFTIAKKALRKEHLSKLKELPLHAAEGDLVSSADAPEEFVPGTDYSKKPTPGEFNSSLVPEKEQPVEDNPYTKPLGGAFQESTSQPMASEASAQFPTQPDSRPPEAPVAPDQTQSQPIQKQEKSVATPQDHLQNLNSETGKFAMDLSAGHIKPETMQDLFGKKDTLGKVGTLFGLLLSGVGSGLSGQPNAVLQMMNNEINNDLEAQKASATNKQNLLRLNIDNEFNKARVGLTGAETELAKKNAGIAGTELTKSQLMLTYLQKQMNEINKMSDSNPQKANATQMLNGMKQIVGQEIQQNHAKAAAQMGAVDYDKLNRLEVQAELKIPGVKGMPTPTDIHEATKEAAGLEEARAMRNDFNGAFDALDKMHLAGKLSPHARESYVQSLAGKLAKASAGRYNQQEAQSQINSMIPQIGDWNQTRGIRKENNNKFFDILEAGTPTLNRFGLKNEASTGESGETKKIGNSTYTKVPGGWKKVGSK